MMDMTGARWGLEGAEAILKLRAVIATGDFQDYWRFHLRQEHKRIRPGVRQSPPWSRPGGLRQVGRPLAVTVVVADLR
jgi:hypothetical protein